MDEQDEIDEFHANKDKLLLRPRRGINSPKRKRTLHQEILSVRVPSSDEEDEDKNQNSIVGKEQVLSDDGEGRPGSVAIFICRDDGASDYSELSSNDDELVTGIKDASGLTSWGRKKSAFYADIGGQKPSNSQTGSKGDIEVDSDEDEQLEEEEAISIQQRMAKQLSDACFDLPVVEDLSTADPGKSNANLPKVPEPLNMCVAVCPVKGSTEPLTLNVLEEYRKVSRFLQELRGKGSSDMERHQLQMEIHCNYLLNLNFFLLLSSKGESTRGHPVLKRIAQWKALADQCISEADAVSEAKGSRRSHSSRSLIPTDDSPPVEDEDQSEVRERREVTYQIAKNKNTTRRKKAEHRNPRVKHKTKFRKATIKRKSTVPALRKEIHSYAGESRGINARVVRGVKLQ